MAGSFTDYYEAKVLNTLRGTTLTAPAAIYAALHKATTLSAAAASGQAVISTVFSPGVGSTVTINLPGPTTETFTVACERSWDGRDAREGMVDCKEVGARPGPRADTEGDNRCERAWRWADYGCWGERHGGCALRPCAVGHVGAGGGAAVSL